MKIDPTLQLWIILVLDHTDLLVTKVKGLLAPVPVQLQDGDDVPDGSEDG